MELNSTFEGDLERLRDAARHRDWGAAQEALTRVLMVVEFYSGLEIALTRLHNHLSVFERDHPEAMWARQMLVSVVSFGIAPHGLPPEASQTYSSPGAANFLSGLFDVLRSVERRTPLENRVRFLASAISHALLADLAAYWYGEHPEAWAQQQEHGDEADLETGYTIRQQVYATFWLDEAVAKQDTAAWLAVAGDIEAKLKKQ